MDTLNSASWKATDFFLILVCILILVPCLFYPYAFSSPDLGFTLSSANWKVISAYPCAPNTPCLKVGDQVFRVQGMDRHQFDRTRWFSLQEILKAEGTVRFDLVRQGQPLTLQIGSLKPRIDLPQLIFDLVAPLVFWLMGTVVVIFLRPRDERWLVLVLFSYDTALWIATGIGARVSGSWFLFHAVIWFFAPLCLHLHLILPNPLLRARARIAILGGLYALSLALVVADFAGLRTGISYLQYVLAGTLLAILLLVGRLVWPASPAARGAVGIMLFGIVVGRVPLILFQAILPRLLEETIREGQSLRWAYNYIL